MKQGQKVQLLVSHGLLKSCRRPSVAMIRLLAILAVCLGQEEPPSCTLLQTQITLQKTARNETAQGVCVANLTEKDCELPSMCFSNQNDTKRHEMNAREYHSTYQSASRRMFTSERPPGVERTSSPTLGALQCRWLVRCWFQGHVGECMCGGAPDT